MLEAFSRNRVLTLLVVLVLASLAAGAFAPGYLSLATASVVLSNSLVLALISLGTMVVIITRNIDVSSGSVLGLSAAVLGLTLNAGASLPLAVALCIATGIAAGAVNGVLVAYLGIPSIVATLGTLGFYRGLMLAMTGGRWIEDLPQGLKALAANATFGISMLTLIVLGMLVLIWLLLRATNFGRSFYAVGDNRAAAHHLGIPVRLVQFTAFIITGICAALAGLTFAAQIGFIPNQAGNGVELKAIAVNVLGGVSLLGGTGSVGGVIAAVLFLTSIDSALVFLKIPAYWNDFIAGAILLSVILLDGRIRLIVSRRIRAKRYAVHDRTERPAEFPTTTSANAGADQ